MGRDGGFHNLKIRTQWYGPGLYNKFTLQGKRTKYSRYVSFTSKKSVHLTMKTFSTSISNFKSDSLVLRVKQ